MARTLNLKNVPDDVFTRLGVAAKAHSRSLNEEAIERLEKALAPSGAAQNERFPAATRLRARLKAKRVKAPKAPSLSALIEEARHDRDPFAWLSEKYSPDFSVDDYNGELALEKFSEELALAHAIQKTGISLPTIIELPLEDQVMGVIDGEVVAERPPAEREVIERPAAKAEEKEVNGAGGFLRRIMRGRFSVRALLRPAKRSGRSQSGD